MPPLIWASDPLVAILDFETRHKSPAAAALFSWAVWAVDSLHYLDDIDSVYDTSYVTVGGHRPDVVDVAHARWATGTAATALDLCAAGLGRAFCNHNASKELALVQFDPTERRVQQRRTRLPPRACQWVDMVLADANYLQIKEARDWLTHSRLRRHFTLAAGGPPQRLELELAVKVSVRKLIEEARDCTTRLVQGFVDTLPQL